jgi:DNA-binding response OmpR family regulator
MKFMDIDQNLPLPDPGPEFELKVQSGGDFWNDLIQSNLPIGLFKLDRKAGTALVNNKCAQMLALSYPDSEILPFTDFNKALAARVARPISFAMDFDLILGGSQEMASWWISFDGDLGNPAQLIIFKSALGDDTDVWGGLIIEVSPENKPADIRLQVLEDIITRSRKISASAGGNLEALAANLSHWNTDLVHEFLLDSKTRLHSLNTNLDLVFILFDLIKGQAVYPVTVEIGRFLHDLISSYTDLDLIFPETSSLGQTNYQVRIDPEMTRLAFIYLFDDLADRQLDQQPLEIHIEQVDGFVRIRFQRSRNLTLPGMDFEDPAIKPRLKEPSVYLAEQIISAQGGKIQFDRLPLDAGSGPSLTMDLPLVPDLENAKPRRRFSLEDREITGRIVLAESQPEYQLALTEKLSNLGYRIDLTGEGVAALDMVQRINPDLVITARNLPGMDGLLLTQGIRRWSPVPILMLSSRTGIEDLLQAFQAGVDDYLIKPFPMDELVARTQAAIRRSLLTAGPAMPDIFHTGGIRIDFSTRQVWIKGALIHLTPIEYNLLVYMARQRKQIMTYDQLLERVWEGPDKGSRQGLFVHIRRLREKIETDPEKPRIIQNKWGIGYEFNP